MTTETIIQIFSGVVLIGLIRLLLDDGGDDPPDKGMMRPIYQGIGD